MNCDFTLPRFSIGVGDRFARQAKAQLAACRMAAATGTTVVPVWNKSNREHLIIGSDPNETRRAADQAVRELGWQEPYFLDADHIGLKTVERFLEPCDFFTIDVADHIGQPAQSHEVDAFIKNHPELLGDVHIENIAVPFRTDRAFLAKTINKFLEAVHEARKVYRVIAEHKGDANFVTEISMDETDSPQTPVELLIILAAIADANIPIQTIAPKFTGRFNKGVDYVGDVDQFAKEFNDDIATLAFATRTYDLPANLKLSVHSGSDKFSLYPVIHRALTSSGAGVHLKTAGTTWLEELIGLAIAGGSGLAIAKSIYREGFVHADELCAPYASVIDIDRQHLPEPREVDTWTSEQYVAALRHDPQNVFYNRSFRQLLHVSFKIAAKLGATYLGALDEHEAVIGQEVTRNLFDRHIRPVFLGS